MVQIEQNKNAKEKHSRKNGRGKNKAEWKPNLHLPLVVFVLPYKFSNSFVSFRASKREYRSYRLDVYPLVCLVNECLLCDVKSILDRER